jgi:hypothetical protein
MKDFNFITTPASERLLVVATEVGVSFSKK